MEKSFVKITSFQIFVWLVIFHDTEGPITKIWANWEKKGNITNHYPGAVLINI